jgi:SNF2 family DNA or RNA helicase
MGLGKTLSIIALIAHDKVAPFHASGLAQNVYSVPGNRSRCTLVIVPPGLLDTWEGQLRMHSKEDSLRWARHHDRCRFRHVAEIEAYDVILTTYNTVSSEFKRQKESILHNTLWHRIILDEAHTIRDNHTQTSRAVCALRADRRWAVTGTPIQNHPRDFLALVQFLQAFPYGDPEQANREILRLWKTNTNEGKSRFKKLIAALTLVRTIGAIDLPDRRDEIFRLQFTASEKRIYELFEEAVLASCTKAQNGESDAVVGQADILKGFNALRLICNFGTLFDTNRYKTVTESTETEWGPSGAQRLFNRLILARGSYCSQCSTHVSVPDDIGEIVAEGPPADGKPLPMVSQCEKILCDQCVPKMDSQLSWCGHDPACDVLSVHFEPSADEVSAQCTATVNAHNLPTKIKALLNDIQQFPESKSVVFSAWRGTLDHAAYALSSAGISFERYDGSIKEKDRASALDRFSKDPGIKVILFTISCGAVGLDLTAADRAYLMEPQWNPTVEDQALARVYRMGQKRPVTTVRFIMEASWEDRVITVQKQKSGFANLLMSHRTGPPTTPEDFEHLKSLLQ